MNVVILLPEEDDPELENFNLMKINRWLDQHVGRGTWMIRFEEGYDLWQAFYDHPSRSVDVRFVDPRMATLFKLTWGGR